MCYFQGALPANKYTAAADLSLQTSGMNNKVTKTIKTPVEIDEALAAAARSQSTGFGSEERPHTPLILEPERLAQTFRRNRIKPITIKVTNPTQETMKVAAKFRNSFKKRSKRVKTRIKPAHFKLRPGRTTNVKFTPTPKAKQGVFGRLMFTVKGMDGSLPASIPILLTPEKTKLQAMARIVGFQARFVGGGTHGSFTGTPAKWRYRSLGRRDR